MKTWWKLHRTLGARNAFIVLCSRCGVDREVHHSEELPHNCAVCGAVMENAGELPETLCEE